MMADVASITSRMTQSVTTGLAATDDLGKGWRVDSSLQLRSPVGARALYAIGPMCCGELFESSAIPEIRRHARDLSRRLTRDAVPS